MIRLTRRQFAAITNPKPKRAKRKPPRRDLAWEAEMRQLPGKFIPIRLVNESNNRDHWAVKDKRRKEIRQWVRLALAGMRWRVAMVYWRRCFVTLTRYGPRRMDDDGNIRSCKPARDEVAHVLGVDDGSVWYDWQYGQVVTGPGRYGLRIVVEAV